MTQEGGTMCTSPQDSREDGNLESGLAAVNSLKVFCTKQNFHHGLQKNLEEFWNEEAPSPERFYPGSFRWETGEEQIS